MEKEEKDDNCDKRKEEGEKRENLRVPRFPFLRHRQTLQTHVHTHTHTHAAPWKQKIRYDTAVGTEQAKARQGFGFTHSPMNLLSPHCQCRTVPALRCAVLFECCYFGCCAVLYVTARPCVFPRFISLPKKWFVISRWANKGTQHNWTLLHYFVVAKRAATCGLRNAKDCCSLCGSCLVIVFVVLRLLPINKTAKVTNTQRRLLPILEKKETITKKNGWRGREADGGRQTEGGRRTGSSSVLSLWSADDLQEHRTRIGRTGPDRARDTKDDARATAAARATPYGYTNGRGVESRRVAAVPASTLISHDGRLLLLHMTGMLTNPPTHPPSPSLLLFPCHPAPSKPTNSLTNEFFTSSLLSARRE